MSVKDCKAQLDLLQDLVNEALLQTGKAIKHVRKLANGNLGEANVILRERLPPTIRTFNHALHDLEKEITDAKAVMLRDLAKVRARKAPPPDLKVKVKDEDAPGWLPMPATPSAIIPSPSVAPKSFTSKHPMAPFPNMGGDTLISPAPLPVQSPVQQQQHPVRNFRPLQGMPAASSAAHTVRVMEARMGHGKPSPGLALAAVPAPVSAAVKPALQAAFSSQTASKGVVQEANMGMAPSNSGLNFTNMTFTLATSVNPTPGRMAIPAAATPATAAAAAASATQQQTQMQPAPGRKPEVMQATSIPNVDSGAADSMDVGLELGEGGRSGDAMDVMHFRETGMGYGQFDEAYFGLE